MRMYDWNLKGPSEAESPGACWLWTAATLSPHGVHSPGLPAQPKVRTSETSVRPSTRPLSRQSCTCWSSCSAGSVASGCHGRSVATPSLPRDSALGPSAPCDTRVSLQLAAARGEVEFVRRGDVAVRVEGHGEVEADVDSAGERAPRKSAALPPPAAASNLSDSGSYALHCVRSSGSVACGAGAFSGPAHASGCHGRSVAKVPTSCGSTQSNLKAPLTSSFERSMGMRGSFTDHQTINLASCRWKGCAAGGCQVLSVVSLTRLWSWMSLFSSESVLSGFCLGTAPCGEERTPCRRSRRRLGRTRTRAAWTSFHEPS